MAADVHTVDAYEHTSTYTDYHTHADYQGFSFEPTTKISSYSFESQIKSADMWKMQKGQMTRSVNFTGFIETVWSL